MQSQDMPHSLLGIGMSIVPDAPSLPANFGLLRNAHLSKSLIKGRLMLAGNGLRAIDIPVTPPATKAS